MASRESEPTGFVRGTERSERGRHIHSGAIVDGFRVGECIHKGGTGYIYKVTAPADKDVGFPLIMKAPALGAGEPTIGIDSFEIEQMILPALSGPHVPRFVAAGDLTATPYIVMEWIDGMLLAEQIARAPLTPEAVARVGAEMADAVHSIHAQDVIHFDLKPENFIMRPNGDAVLLDFGFARHAHYPDLLAEQREFAAGSAAYVAPEQLQNNRSDPRSDLFALGVLLYELATGRQPFGAPETLAGMRDRLWREPVPPRAENDKVPPYLQEVILRCLEPIAANRYQSAAHIAFDLRHPEQVPLTKRAARIKRPGVLSQIRRWWRAYRHAKSYIDAVVASINAPVVMAAIDTTHVDDPRHPYVLAATRRLLAHNAEFRLMCVSVIDGGPLGEGSGDMDSASARHLEHKVRLRHWAEPLKLPASRMSLHVAVASDPAAALLDLARANHVDLIVIGAPGPDERTLAWWRSVASTVTANAVCSVHVVRIPETHLQAG